MRAITVQQPWAWAIVHGGKDVENRTRIGTWRPAIGQRIAVHAGQRWSDRAEFGAPIVLAYSRAHGVIGGLVPRPRDEEMVFGAVIGSVIVDDVHPEQGGCCAPWGETSYIEHGGTKRVDIVHLVLTRPLPCTPIPCTGRLGLWTLPKHVAADLDDLDDLGAVHR